MSEESYDGPERRQSAHEYTGPERRSTALTTDELEYLKKMIVEDQRRRWLAKQMLTFATWIAAIIIGLTVSWDFLKRIFKAGMSG